MELLDVVHRIDAEIGGRPLSLFLFLGERHGHAERQAVHAARDAAGHVVHRGGERP
jgi:hypothetical protein